MERKKFIVLIPVIIIVIIVLVICNLGIGYYRSGSAVRDLTEELTTLYGEPYTGREVENGTEDMEFSVESGTFFLTDENFRYFWGLDYRYECKVIYTTYSNDETVSVRTITYDAVDPMGPDVQFDRAHLVMESVKEQIAQS
ncbi:MAG: hypothetical protein PUE84_04055 [Firmicutes bacterium]|nr:hypothetical protein [Bacillota bacterium]